MDAGNRNQMAPGGTGGGGGGLILPNFGIGPTTEDYHHHHHPHGNNSHHHQGLHPALGFNEFLWSAHLAGFPPAAAAAAGLFSPSLMSAFPASLTSSASSWGPKAASSLFAQYMMANATMLPFDLSRPPVVSGGGLNLSPTSQQQHSSSKFPSPPSYIPSFRTKNSNDAAVDLVKSSTADKASSLSPPLGKRSQEKHYSDDENDVVEECSAKYRKKSVEFLREQAKLQQARVEEAAIN